MEATQTECQHHFYFSKEDDEFNQARFKAYAVEFFVQVGQEVMFKLRRTCVCCKTHDMVLKKVKKIK